jgi:hypothetical protein
MEIAVLGLTTEPELGRQLPVRDRGVPSLTRAKSASPNKPQVLAALQAGDLRIPRPRADALFACEP